MALNIVDESTLTVAGTSIGLSSASPTLAASELLGARQAVITVKTAPVYYRNDGDNATSSDTLLYPDDMLNILGDSMRSILTNLRFIRMGSVSASLVIRWYDRDVINVPIVVRGTGHDKTGIGHGVKTISSGGDHEVLASATAAKIVIIQAQTDNTNAVAVGAESVDATIATGNGIILYAGDVITLEIDDLADVWIDAITSGEGVRYTYLT